MCLVACRLPRALKSQDRVIPHDRHPELEALTLIIPRVYLGVSRATIASLLAKRLRRASRQGASLHRPDKHAWKSFHAEERGDAHRQRQTQLHGAFQEAAAGRQLAYIVPANLLAHAGVDRHPR